MSEAPLLTVEGLTISFAAAGRPRRVVDNASFTIGKSQIVGLVGESGSGKTMIGRSLLGLLPSGANCSAARMNFAGVELTSLSNRGWREVRGSQIGMIFQEPMVSLNPAMTIGRQCAEALKLHRGLAEAECRRRTCELLSRVRIADPEQILDRFPHEFSGGMRQRIMLASVLLPRPKLLVADEPTTALDVIVQRDVLDIMAELTRQTGTSVLLITHDLGLVARYADVIAVMRCGEIVEAGETAKLLEAPSHPYTRELLNSVPRRRHRPALAHTGEPLMALENVKIAYSRQRLFRRHPPVQAVNGVSLEIYRGETLALVGESGSGKTSLGRALLGLMPISAGTLRHEGGVLAAGDQRSLQRRRGRAQLVYQDPYSALDPRMPALKIVEEGLCAQPGLANAQRRQRAWDALKEVGMAGFETRLPHQLSGGQRQRLSIARALVSRPDFIVADEPVAALDMTIQAQILALLEKLKQAHGFTCIFISHDLHVVEQIADRVAILHRGELVECGSVSQIFDTPSHPYTRALLAARSGLEPTGTGYRVASRNSSSNQPGTDGAGAEPQPGMAVKEQSQAKEQARDPS